VTRALVVAIGALVACACAGGHGSAGAGGALLLTGAGDGARSRGEASVSVTNRRFGGVVAWRSFDRERDGLVTAGVLFEAAAARPRLVLSLHGDVGWDLDRGAPLVGGGLRTVLAVWGPFGVASDAGAYLIVDGVDSTRLQLQTSATLVLCW
jgi:hypothetical protein